MRATTKRRVLAVEVVQTSAMDCGPASLKCLLEGFGIPVSYGRLREACQTGVDGTSIDTLEEVAGQLGLAAEQVMLPLDHLLLKESAALPAIVVTRNASGTTHFVVLWRNHGRVMQVMDPATGRRWSAPQDLLKDIYVHQLNVAASYWREWAGSENFLAPLRRRMLKLGLSGKAIKKLIGRALADASWQALATLDAAVRMSDAIVRSGGIKQGRQAALVVERFFAESLKHDADGADRTAIIPKNYWLAQAAAPDAEGSEQLTMRGAVLVTARGKKPTSSSTPSSTTADASSPMPVELAAALEEKPDRPLRELWRFLRADNLLAPMLIIAALAVAAFGVLGEAVLFQGLFELSRKLTIIEQRIGTVVLLLAFGAALFLLELPLAASLLRMGRKLEMRLRVAFLEKIPRLGDRYFQSRLISDMAERSHSVQTLRLLPTLGGQLLRLMFELLLTTAGIIWLDPAGALVAIAVAVVAVSLPFIMQSRLTERDLRIRNHNAGLSRFYLDALLGLVAVRAHGAEKAVRREHENLLVEWMQASFAMLRAVVTVEAVQSLLGFGLAGLLLINHFAHGGQYGGVLLLVYWSLNLPVLGEEIALIAHQYPMHRNVVLRLLEPLGAPEESEVWSTAFRRNGLASELPPEGGTPNAVALNFENVSVCAAGHEILSRVDLQIPPGSHIAVVGPSGAGKSSLAGLLLGWHKPASGVVLVDGEPLDEAQLDGLRHATAWVDPSVQLWNRSLIDNLRYGASAESTAAIRSAIEAADLYRVLEKLPDGLQTQLGESGSLLSGGEGQRVRLGRAMLRPEARLVILDEAFRGLDRDRRRQLMARAREMWRAATLVCITHDVAETKAFERVLVIEQGRIVEDGDPLDLLEQPQSRYRDLLEAEEMVREGLWSSDEWRRIRLERGLLIEEHPLVAQTTRKFETTDEHR